ncbi:MAG: hypothetical protein ABIS45_16500 [Burkholderiales bacterium]
MTIFWMRAMLGIPLATAGFTAVACGVCVEDKIAAAYDYAIVTQAAAKKHQVAFFALDGRVIDNEVEQRTLARIAQGTRGVDPFTARVSTANAALSVAFDPAVVTFAALERALGKRLAPKGLTLLRLQVMAQTSDFKKRASP